MCVECGRAFSTSTPRKTCSRTCSRARQDRAVKELRGGVGITYKKWLDGLLKKVKKLRGGKRYAK